VAGLFVLVSFDASEAGGSVAGPFDVATLVAGALGGWIFGAPARRAQTDRDWLLVILGLAVTAVIIGAAASGMEVGLASAQPGTPLHEVAGDVLGITILFATVGVLVLGLFILPATLMASVVWTVLMVVLFRTAGSGSTPRAPR
jgi:hypothetical protein